MCPSEELLKEAATLCDFIMLSCYHYVTITNVENVTSGLLLLSQNSVCAYTILQNIFQMYFIEKGEVDILSLDESKVIIKLKTGQHFGEGSLLFAEPRATTIRYYIDLLL